MFYYISFLRPPPLNVTPTEQILITPQISNDLRTEYLDDPIDIYYTWSLHAAPAPTLTTPAKLTSWRPSTAYKTISVPRPPPDVRNDSDESAWRLTLSCGATTGTGTSTKNARVVLLGDTLTTGNVPFPVTSMPVRFLDSRRPGHAPQSRKQDRIARSYAVRVPPPLSDSDGPIVFEVTEQTSFDLDKKVWDSGIGLCSWLVQLFRASKDAETDGTPTPSRDLRDLLFSTDGASHVLELGAGTGIVAITLGILRSTLDPSDRLLVGSIVTTDLSSAVPILQENITSNLALMPKCTPQAAVLDWEIERVPEPVRAQLDAGLDVIVMADVAYNTASFPALIATLSRLVEQNRSGRRPKVLMGYKERHPGERSLWDRARDIGIHFQQIGQVNGAGGNPVEIWLG